MALNKAKVITVTSVKGGVGKTTTVLNLAGVYSKLNKRVLVIDLDLFSGDIASILNINYKLDIYNLYEDVNNKKYNSLDDYITSYDEYIKVLPAPKDPRYARKIDSSVLNFVLYKASLKFDVILIDTNHILTDINLFSFDYSDMILYIISNDSMNLKNMKTMVSILNNMGKVNYKIVLNDSINKNVKYIIPSSFYQKNIDKYIINGKVLTLDNSICKKNKSTLKVFNLIAQDLLNERE